MSVQSARALAQLEDPGEFARRHIGIDEAAERRMLAAIGEPSRQALVERNVPRSIARTSAMELPPAATEAAAIAELRIIANKNRVFRNFIGQGYHGTHTPTVIQRNVLESPAWYTAYTPYQAEISQGRLEALVNFQTMVCDLTGMAIANASMLDEATAAAEAMTLLRRVSASKSNVFVVAPDVLPQTIDVVRTRAAPLGIAVVVAVPDGTDDAFGVLVQYPGADGEVRDYRA